MNRKERLLDFVLFVVSDFEELLNNVSLFFKQPFKLEHKLIDELDDGTYVYEDITKYGETVVYEDFIGKSELRTKVKLPEEYTFPVFNNYLDYVDEYLEPLPKKLFTKQNYLDDFHSIGDFLSKKDELLLLKYLNENFCYKYSKEEYKFIDELSREELSDYFERYIKFKNVNDKAYISFFVLLLKGIEKQSKKVLNKELHEINKYKKRLNQLEYELAQEFKELMLERYKKKLFDSISENKIEIAGFFQSFENKEVFISFEETLINQLSILPDNFNNYSLDYKLSSSINQLCLQYLNYSYFGRESKISETNRTEREAQQRILDNLKKKNSALISFLNEKRLADGDINILFNLLHKNKFSALKIGFIEFSREETLFHILYAFYVFDFYKESLDTMGDFEILISNLTSFDKKIAEPLMGYYRAYENDNNSRHLPFNRYDKTLKKIQDILNIEGRKLKQVKDVIENKKIEVNKYSEIFNSDLGWTLFKHLYLQYENDKKHVLSNFSFVYYALKKDGYLHCTGIKFIDFMSSEYDIHLPKIDSRQSGNDNSRYKSYYLIKKLYSTK